jgi:very-short-patch-repair endonuclease
VDRAKRETEGAMREKERRSRKLAKRLRKTMTKAEVVLWTRLRQLAHRGHKFRNQHPIGPYVADFAHVEAMLVIEVDGATHSTEDELAHDRRRDAYMRSLGWTIMRVQNEQIYADVAAAVEAIERRLPPPSRPLRGRATSPVLRGRPSEN